MGTSSAEAVYLAQLFQSSQKTSRAKMYSIGYGGQLSLKDMENIKGFDLTFHHNSKESHRRGESKTEIAAWIRPQSRIICMNIQNIARGWNLGDEEMLVYCILITDLASYIAWFILNLSLYICIHHNLFQLFHATVTKTKKWLRCFDMIWKWYLRRIITVLIRVSLRHIARSNMTEQSKLTVERKCGEM